MEIYFAMAIRMLLLYMKPLFLSVFQFFSVNRKRIVLLTLFCLLKNRNNGNFTVPIHKIPVMALLIIRIINFRFRFKCGIRSTDWRARGKRYCVRKKFKRNGRGLLGRRWPAGRDDCVEKGLIGRCEVLRMGW